MAGRLTRTPWTCAFLSIQAMLQEGSNSGVYRIDAMCSNTAVLLRLCLAPVMPFGVSFSCWRDRNFLLSSPNHVGVGESMARIQLPRQIENRLMLGGPV